MGRWAEVERQQLQGFSCLCLPPCHTSAEFTDMHCHARLFCGFWTQVIRPVCSKAFDNLLSCPLCPTSMFYVLVAAGTIKGTDGVWEHLLSWEGGIGYRFPSTNQVRENSSPRRRSHGWTLVVCWHGASFFMWVSERVWLILGAFSSAKNWEELPRWCVLNFPWTSWSLNFSAGAKGLAVTGVELCLRAFFRIKKLSFFCPWLCPWRASSSLQTSRVLYYWLKDRWTALVTTAFRIPNGLTGGAPSLASWVNVFFTGIVWSQGDLAFTMEEVHI